MKIDLTDTQLATIINALTNSEQDCLKVAMDYRAVRETLEGERHEDHAS